MSTLGVVVIGRNEGERLQRCLGSLEPDQIPVVYVDSGSTDASVATARNSGVAVVELDPSRPFSAGRARNEGFARCLEEHPEVEFVMFVDGDCEVVPGWLARAEGELVARPELAAVCGRRRESRPERSVYNRLADLEWETPVGLVPACGGDALFRVRDFQAVGGFDPTAKAGEEPELCQRLRQRGRAIARIDAEMTRHDLNMTRFAEWWRRQLRVGYHGLDVESRFPPTPGPDGTSPPSLFGASLRRARVWGIGWPVVVAVGMALAWQGLGRMAALEVLACGVAILGAQAARLAWRVRHRVARPSDALAHGGLMVIEKWANLSGQVSYRIDRARGRTARLIEYKRATAAALAGREPIDSRGTV